MFCANYPTKISIELNGIEFSVIEWCDEIHTDLSRPLNIQGKEPFLNNFVKENFDTGLYSDIYRLTTQISTLM